MTSEATLLLRLAGPTQAWDVHRAQPDLTRRPIKRDLSPERLAPTNTGLAGLLGSALGRYRIAGPPRHARPELADLLALDIVVRADQPGRARTEFRTTRRRTQSRMIVQPLIESVLDDAVFLAGIGGDRAFLDQIAAALHAPRWALFLGRREYPPTYPLLLGVVDGDPVDILRAHDWIAAPWYRRTQPRRTEARLYRPRDQRRATELGYIQIDNPDGYPDRISPGAWIDALIPPTRKG
ncbi:MULTISPECIES: type I-E CRISPR-associated protein Cas5/CasD [Gordonia]|uniref:Putative CRISPR-associated protein n=1 Tax=Gordonia sihwensis NBRC 108236 TaxID=1223544 RepID=L7LQL1_9ACTN|nr:MULTISPECIES: type I-E CRISPR-associated protein Cas5/CasD [Gordonia]AUH70560.1 type I-E CRISPR-associated protein Cas5/CasD [Gordonia sp. YC-JH1]WFN95179.1 type I-E CRISPR-associated protein Cas5/CasD [Gordonia sihwensis]GAC62388.1 putative CRISPR-associated protein [Gordonia sihwensis NBRC 108236]